MAQKTVFCLLDDRFAHDEGTVAGVTPQRVEWDRSLESRVAPVFFSHERMLGEYSSIPRSRRFGLLFESQSQAEVYRSVRSVMNEFSLVFTHSSELLREFQNARWIPGGGIWIGGARGGGNQPEIFEKSRMVSFFSSNKMRCDAHRMRYRLALDLETRDQSVDVFRQLRLRPNSSAQAIGVDNTSVHTFPIPPLEYLRSYRFSVIMENFVDDAYFTEKILNCFATGTVPIYRGAKKIADFFDQDGIIAWESEEQLTRDILPSLSAKAYDSRRIAIERNFEQSKQYRTIEDYLIEHYLDEIERSMLVHDEEN